MKAPKMSCVSKNVECRRIFDPKPWAQPELRKAASSANVLMEQQGTYPGTLKPKNKV